MVDINKDQLQVIIRQLKRQQLTNANREALIIILEGLVGEASESNVPYPERRKRRTTTASLESQPIHPDEGLSDQLSAILDEIQDSLKGYQEVHVFSYTSGRLDMIASRMAEQEPRQDRSHPRPRGLTYTVARLGQAMVIPDMANHPLYSDSRSNGAIVGLPLKSGHRVIGVVTVSRKPVGEFSQAEMSQLEDWADRMAREIEAHSPDVSKTRSRQPDILTNDQIHSDLRSQLAIEIKRTLDTNSPLALVVIELGKVGDLSQVYGRRAGDYLQQAVATAISEALRKTDVLVNYTGNRWAVILKGADEATARAIRGRIEKMLNRRRFGLPGENAQSVSIKMGIATFPDSGSTPDMLVDAAENALTNSDGGNYYEPTG